jgi:DNA-directed RNA polymerase specialized sigma24 family protein
MSNKSAEAAKDKLYKKFKSGDGGALIELLEGDRQRVFDYLMRMTGQISRSADTVDEVYQGLTEETLETVSTWAELRVVLYTTARRFNADIWNADTAKLMNFALEGPDRTQEMEASPDLAALVAVDHAWRSLVGPEREALHLFVRVGMTPEDVSDVMGIGASEAQALAGSASRQIAAAAGAFTGGAAKLERLIDLQPLHPLPERSTQSTVNLSVVMQGIKTRPAGLWSPWRLGLLVALVAGAAIWYLKPEWIQRAKAALRALSVPSAATEPATPTATDTRPGMPLPPPRIDHGKPP